MGTNSGAKRRHLAIVWCSMVVLTLTSLVLIARAGESGGPPVAPLESPPSYPGSQYHGQLNGDGNVIPCRCRFRGEQVMLGAVVCMETHVGTVLTRCDLRDGNTSWVPSNSPCIMSEVVPPSRAIVARGH